MGSNAKDFLSSPINENARPIPSISVATLFHGVRNASTHGVLADVKDFHVKQNCLFAACSISKMITAIGILKLAQEQGFSIYEDVNHILTDWQLKKGPYSENVTIGNILAHQAGFLDSRYGFMPYEEGTEYPDTIALLEGKTKYNPKKVEIEYPPGTRFEYSDSGYCILQKIIEEKTKMSFPDAMRHLVFDPLELEDTFFATNVDLMEMKHDNRFATGHVKHGMSGRIKQGWKVVFPHLAASGLWCTPKDMLSIIEDLMDSWVDDSGKLLRYHIVRDMLKPFSERFSWMGLGCFLFSTWKGFGFESKGWDVGYQCMLKAYPQEKSAIVVMSNYDPDVDQTKSLVGAEIRRFDTIIKEGQRNGTSNQNP